MTAPSIGPQLTPPRVQVFVDKPAASKIFAFLNRLKEERSFAELWGLVKRA